LNTLTQGLALIGMIEAIDDAERGKWLDHVLARSLIFLGARASRKPRPF